MFKKVFDYASFNSLFITKQCSDELMKGFDLSYISKSGKHTPNEGYFYSDVEGMIKRGMEFGCLALNDVRQNTTYHLEAIQTLPVNKKDAQTGLIKQYCKIFLDRKDVLKRHSKILTLDSWFKKQKFIESMT